VALISLCREAIGPPNFANLLSRCKCSTFRSSVALNLFVPFVKASIHYAPSSSLLFLSCFPSSAHLLSPYGRLVSSHRSHGLQLLLPLHRPLRELTQGEQQALPMIRIRLQAMPEREMRVTSRLTDVNSIISYAEVFSRYEAKTGGVFLS